MRRRGEAPATLLRLIEQVDEHAVGAWAREHLGRNGRFRISVPSGVSSLTVRRLGFRPLRHVLRAASSDLRLILSEAAVELNETIVTGTADAT